MKILKAISYGLAWVERSLLVLLLSIIVVLAFYQVILRNLFASGLLWADPLLRHLVLWMGFLGASLATQQEKHINLDIVSRFASPRTTNILRIATNLFAAIITALLANAGWTFLESEISTRDVLFTIGQTEYMAWWFQVIIPAGFGLISFRFLLRTIERVLGAFNPSPSVPPTERVPTIER